MTAPNRRKRRSHRVAPRLESLSYNQSPITFIEAAVATIAAPGASVATGLTKMNSRASESISPQSGVPGDAPRPTNERLDSVTSEPANTRYELATAVDETFGQICDAMIRREAPCAPGGSCSGG